MSGGKQINCVAFSPDGKIIAAGDGGMIQAGSVRLYDTVTGDVKSTLTVDSSVHSVSFSPDGSKIAAAYSNEIQLFDTQTQAKLGSPLRGHSGYVTAVSYSCSFSNVWCVLTIEYCTGLPGVFASVQMVKKWPVEAGTKP